MAMKNIKKLLILLLVIVMSCTVLLTSCGNDDDGDGSGGSGSKTYKYEKPLNVYFDGDSVIMESSYDKSGKIVSNRVTVLSWGETAIINYTYDNAGKMTKIGYQEGFYYPAFEYQLTLVDGISYSTDAKVEYHENGAVKKICLDDYLTFVFDETGRIASLDDELVFNYEGDSKTPGSYTDAYNEEETVITYDDKGYVTALTSADGVSVTYTYDKNGNITNETIVDGDESIVCECEYDKKNNRTKITETEYEEDPDGEFDYKSTNVSSSIGQGIFIFESIRRAVRTFSTTKKRIFLTVSNVP